MPRTKEIDISEFGYPEPVIIQAMTPGMQCDLMDALIKEGGAKMSKDGKMMNIPPGLSLLMMIEKSIIQAPFPFDREGIRNMDLALFNYIAKAVEELNSPLVME